MTFDKQTDADMTVSQIIVGVHDLCKILERGERELVAGEYAHISLASKRLSAVVRDLEMHKQKVAAQ